MRASDHLKELFTQGSIWQAQVDANSPKKLPADEQVVSIFEAVGAAHPPAQSAVGFGLAELDKVFPQGGLAGGAIHEWAMTWATAASKKKEGKDYPPCSLLALLAGNALRASCRETPATTPDKFVFWIGRACWPTPYLLQQTIRPISRCIFIDPPDEKLRAWAVETALRSPAVAAVIAEFKSIRFALSRRFTLAAERGGALGLFIRNAKDLALPSAAASRWQIAPLPSSSLFPRFELELLKCKGQQPLRRHWNVELAFGESHEALSLRIPAAVAVRTDSQKEPHSREAAA